MRKTLIPLLFGLLVLTANAEGKKIGWAFHISNPIGATPIAPYPKIRIKGEVRDSTNAILLCYTFYGSDEYHYVYSGHVVGLEYRRYWQRPGRSENYIYGETGAGIHNYPYNYYNYSSYPYTLEENDKIMALYLGAGVGRHFNFNHFFIDVNAGLRGTWLSTSNYDSRYYTYGPGAIVRINGSFGFQFPSRGSKREHYLKDDF